MWHAVINGSASVTSRYIAALRDEPKMRFYVVASLVDDVGVAISVWIWQLMLAQLFIDQRARATLMMPALLCFVLGSIIAGPLADWPSTRAARQSLSLWRWRTLLYGRGVETIGLGLLVLGLRAGNPTLHRIMPYFLLSAFMKTALRPTRIALEVDLLQRGSPRVDSTGAPLRDESGAPIIYKDHLLSVGSLLLAMTALATIGGLVIGSYLQTALDGRLWIVFAGDVLTNVVFIAVIWRWCRPDAGADAASSERPRVVAAAPPRFARFVFGQFASSLRDGVRYLRQPQQRPLLWLLFGGMLIEVVTEFYDGKMIIKQLLHGSDEQLRRAQILWSVAGMIAVAVLPALADRLRYLGRIFLIIMVVDGAMVVLVGRMAGAGRPAAVLPFAAAMGMDHALTQASSALMGLAQNSASNAAMRGRIAATFAFVVLLLDVVAEGAATGLADAVGIPAMIRSLGWAQIALMLGVAAVGGRKLWNFGLTVKARDDAGLSDASTIEPPPDVLVAKPPLEGAQ